MTPRDYLLRDIKIVLLYLVFGGLEPLGVIIGCLWIWKDAAVDFAFYLGGGLTILGIAGVWFIHRKKPDPGQAKAKEEFQRRLKAGEILARESIVALTQEDIDKITRRNWWKLFFLFPLMGLVLWEAHEAAASYAFVITPVTALSIAFLVYQLKSNQNRTIEKGVKTVITGFVTDKSKRWRSNLDEYSLMLGSIRIRTGKYEYLSSQIGDVLEVELIKGFWGFELRRKKISTVETTLSNK